MTQSSSILIFSSLLALTFAQIPGFGKSPNVKVEQNFNVQQYMGLWYEVEKYPFIFTLGGSCVTANYDLNADGTVKVFNRQIKNNREDTITGQARVIQPGVGILGVTFQNVPFQREANYNVLYTDYNELAVVYSCNSFLGLVHGKVVWILSRQRFPTQFVIDKAHEVLRENGISTIFLTSTDHSKCPGDNVVLYNA